MVVAFVTLTVISCNNTKKANAEKATTSQSCEKADDACCGDKAAACESKCESKCDSTCEGDSTTCDKASKKECKKACKKACEKACPAEDEDSAE